MKYVPWVRWCLRRKKKVYINKPCKLEQAMLNVKTWLQKGITQEVKQLMHIIFQNKPKDFV